MAEPDSLDAFMVGADCLSVELDNALNSDLFLGRINHFTLQFMLPLANTRSERDLLLSTVPVVSDFSRSQRSRVDQQLDYVSFRGIVRIWYEIEMRTLSKPENSAWVDQAERLLQWFMLSGRDVDRIRPSRDVERAAFDDHLRYLRWIDSSGSGGPSAELMCFMNPYWRRVGFIYGSPFDGVVTLRPGTFQEPYSSVARLKERGLYPPRPVGA